MPKANPNIAFMGDSITYYWWLPSTNFGIPGNTSTQMLARFPTQVIGHGYKAVVILAGTNDIRTTRSTLDHQVATAVSDIDAMAQLAEKDNIEVILCRIPPITHLDSRVVELNNAITIFAQTHNYKLVDYYSPMQGHPEYLLDGVHPNSEGYVVMQTALEQVISINY